MKGEEARRIQGWRIKDWKRKKQGWRIKGRMKVRKGVLRKDGWINYWKLKLQGWRINEWKVKDEGWKRKKGWMQEWKKNEWMNEWMQGSGPRPRFPTGPGVEISKLRTNKILLTNLSPNKELFPGFLNANNHDKKILWIIKNHFL